MYFRVIDHYYNDNNENNNKVEECFICYEIKCANGFTSIKLNSNLYYTKTCTCDGFIHKSCLDNWYAFSNSCPICRTKLPEISIIAYASNLDAFTIYIYLHCLIVSLCFICGCLIILNKTKYYDIKNFNHANCSTI